MKFKKKMAIIEAVAKLIIAIAALITAIARLLNSKKRRGVITAP